MAFFACNHVHAAEPWAGRRIVLVAYCVERFAHLRPQDLELLQSAKFCVPTREPRSSLDLVSVQGSFRDLRPSQVTAVTEPIPFPFCATSLLFEELCSGSFQLAACMKQAGFDVMAVDHEGNRRRSVVAIVRLDLRKDASWDFLARVALARVLLALHASPPCGAGPENRRCQMQNGGRHPYVPRYSLA